MHRRKGSNSLLTMLSVVGLVLCCVQCGKSRGKTNDAAMGLDSGGGDGTAAGGGDQQDDDPVVDEYVDGRRVCDRVTALAEAAPPPNLLLVVDRSGSMKDPVAAGLDKKIDVAKQALTGLVSQAAGSIRFGWMHFPGSALGCDPGIVGVRCGDGTDAQVMSAINGLSPSGGTPTSESLAAARAYADLHDDKRASFVILLTDGMANCPNGDGKDENAQDTDLAVKALAALHSDAIDSFVIGLGEAVNASANVPALNRMAEAGGRPRSDPNVKYYPANSLGELQAVFDTIGGVVMSCAYDLKEVPPDPSAIWVYLDGKRIDRDPTQRDGYDYETSANRVRVYGAPCAALQNGSVSGVEIKIGCEPAP